jgi:hypothetical protein
MFHRPIVDAHYFGPLISEQPLYGLIGPDGAFLGALVKVDPAPHQLALVLQLRDPAEAVHATFVRPMIKMGSEPSKVWAVRDTNGNQIVDIVKEVHLFHHPRVESRASCGGREVAVMLKKETSDPEVFLDPSGHEIVRLAKLPDSPWPGARDQRVTITSQPRPDVRIPLICALVRLVTLYGQAPSQPGKLGVSDVLFGQGRAANPGVVDIVDDVLRLFG